MRLTVEQTIDKLAPNSAQGGIGVKVRAVDFVGIAVSDMAAAKEFYGSVLGLELVSDGDQWAEYSAGNVTLSLIAGEAEAIAKRVEAGPWAAVGVALAVADIEAAVAELKAKGVPVVTEVAEFPPCHLATVQDPAGNFVWLHQRKDGTAG